MNKMAAYFGRDLVKSEMKGKGQKQTALDPGGGIVRGVGRTPLYIKGLKDGLSRFLHAGQSVFH